MINLKNYQQNRELFIQQQPQYRELCHSCLQPDFSCYCTHIKKFDPKIKFVILIHPIEVRRRIATGRMSHLCLENSELIMGRDYSNNNQVNEILNNSQNQCAVLYPGVNSVNLTQQTSEQRSHLFDADKTPVIFVIDGTWNTARKTMHVSQNLKALPRLSFTIPHQSQFRVRKQPRENCFSTIEAIHHLIDLLGDRPGFSAAEKQQDGLIYVFNQMVERQLAFIEKALENSKGYNYRRRKT